MIGEKKENQTAYIAPMIEIIDIELAQSVFNSGSPDPSGSSSDFIGDDMGEWPNN